MRAAFPERRRGPALGLTRFGGQRGESVAAIAQGQSQPCPPRPGGGWNGECRRGGQRVPARVWCVRRRQRLQHQRRDEPVTGDRDFFSAFSSIELFFSPEPKLTEKASGSMPNGVWGGSGGRAGGGECGAAAPSGARPRGQPSSGRARLQTGSGERRSSRWIRSWSGHGGEVGRGSRLGSTQPAGAQRFSLRAEAANPELAALVGHRGRRGLRWRPQAFARGGRRAMRNQRDDHHTAAQ